MTPRAARISRSDTRPSALAMYPMTSNVLRKKTALMIARIALARCAIVILGVAIVLMTEQHAEQSADRPGSYDRADEPADDFSFPLHANFLTVT